MDTACAVKTKRGKLHWPLQDRQILWFFACKLTIDHDVPSLLYGRKTLSKRACRLGYGEEETPGKADTPGFSLRMKPGLAHDKRGFRRLDLPRNHPRVAQSSLDMLQAWRANCDIQLILYESSPDNPDPTDVAKVTDYVVAYACKGNASLAEEKAQLKSIIMA